MYAGRPTFPARSRHCTAKIVLPLGNRISFPITVSVHTWTVESERTKAGRSSASSVHGKSVFSLNRQPKSFNARATASELGSKSKLGNPGTPPIGRGGGPLSHTSVLPLPSGREARICTSGQVVGSLMFARLRVSGALLLVPGLASTTMKKPAPVGRRKMGRPASSVPLGWITRLSAVVSPKYVITGPGRGGSVGVGVRVTVGVRDAVGERVIVGVLEGVRVWVVVRVTVDVGVTVGVKENVSVAVGVRVRDAVRVAVTVGVHVGVAVAVRVGEGVRVREGVRELLAVGVAEGLGDGESVRVELGVRLGVPVRVPLEVDEGVTVGDSVLVIVMLAEGVLVRVPVGLNSGVSDG